jgi:uncharacterized membrane protein YphA (DoxX/SURF4 family)
METVIKSSTTYTGYKFKWLTLIRIVLGVVMIIKGIYFFMDNTLLLNLFKNSGIGFMNNNQEMWASIITYFNLLGGVFIATGFLTRWVALLLIPMLAGAVFLNFRLGIDEGSGNFILSIAALALLVLFVKLGSGSISADEFFRTYTHAGEKDGYTRKFFQ